MYIIPPEHTQRRKGSGLPHRLEYIWNEAHDEKGNLSETSVLPQTAEQRPWLVINTDATPSNDSTRRYLSHPVSTGYKWSIEARRSLIPPLSLLKNAVERRKAREYRSHFRQSSATSIYKQSRDSIATTWRLIISLYFRDQTDSKDIYFISILIERIEERHYLLCDSRAWATQPQVNEGHQKYMRTR